MKRKKNVFMVTYGGGHANIIKHIYKKLIANNSYNIILLALTTAPAILDHDSIEYVTISQIAKKLNNYNEIKECGEKIAIKNHDENSGIDFNDSVAYFGIGYYSLTKKYGELEAKKIFDELGRSAFLPVDVMKEIIEGVSADIVVITSSPRMEKAAGIAANELNIPVILINDLPIVDDISFKCKICVMNDWSKKNTLINTNLNSRDIVVTGQPVFEHNLLLEDSSVQKYFKSIRNGYDKVILYLGQPNNLDTEDTIQALLDYANDNHNTRVIIRPHPNDNNFAEIDLLDNLVVTKKGELKYLIYSSDVVITHYSTAGLEAALMGKPLITVLAKSDKALRYKDYGIAIEIDDTSKLKLAIDNCLYNDETKRMLHNGLRDFKNKENATNNIVEVINELLSGRE